MENELDSLLLTDEEYNLGPEEWAKFEDPIPAEYSEALKAKHNHIHKDNPDDGWQDCLDGSDDEDEDMEDATAQ